MVFFGGIQRRREERRVEEAEARGMAQGVAQGMAQGVAQGAAEERQLWEAWNRRRLEAEAEGRSFAELPPSESPSENKADGECPNENRPRPFPAGGGILKSRVSNER